MSSTVPSPYMDIGSRPMTPATENRQARGIEKISAYGRRKPRASASSVLVIGGLVIGGQTSQKPQQYGVLLPCSWFGTRIAEVFVRFDPR